MKLTIHRALAELKILDARIQQGIGAIEPLAIAKKDSPIDGVYDVAEWEKKATSKYQSAVDLIDRQQRLKSAIMKSNATTVVIINKKEFVVIDAINHKIKAAHMTTLIQTLKQRRAVALNKFELLDESVNDKALNQMAILLNKETKDVSIDEKNENSIINTFIENNKPHLIDPLKIDDLIEGLEDDLGNFITEVDAVLSESNATTFIEVD